MSHTNYIPKAGEIYKEHTRKGIVYFAYNHQQGRVPKWGIGTLTPGGVYEKKANIFKNKNGLSLTQCEYGELLNDGARVIRFDVAGKGKYSIDVDRFERFKEQHFDPAYGPQWMINVNYCDPGKPGKRNASIDNPPIETPGYQRPQAQQLPMFDMGIRRGPGGDAWGG